MSEEQSGQSKGYDTLSRVHAVPATRELINYLLSLSTEIVLKNRDIFGEVALLSIDSRKYTTSLIMDSLKVLYLIFIENSAVDKEFHTAYI